MYTGTLGCTLLAIVVDCRTVLELSVYGDYAIRKCFEILSEALEMGSKEYHDSTEKALRHRREC